MKSSLILLAVLILATGCSAPSNSKPKSVLDAENPDGKDHPHQMAPQAQAPVPTGPQTAPAAATPPTLKTKELPKEAVSKFFKLQAQALTAQQMLVGTPVYQSASQKSTELQNYIQEMVKQCGAGWTLAISDKTQDPTCVETPKTK
jgi:hypothetical protein